MYKSQMTKYFVEVTTFRLRAIYERNRRFRLQRRHSEIPLRIIFSVKLICYEGTE